MTDFEVRGAEQFLRLSKALKEAGQGDIRKELNKRLREGAKPIIPATRQEALARLPRRGGFAALVAGNPQRVQVRTGKDPGVRLVVGRKGGGARAAERGSIRHPVFARNGAPRVFVTQAVHPGWFSEPAKAQAPQVRQQLEQALLDIARQVVNKGGSRGVT